MGADASTFKPVRPSLYRRRSEMAPTRRSAFVAMQAEGAIMRGAFCVAYRHRSGTGCDASCSVLWARVELYEMSICATR